MAYNPAVYIEGRYQLSLFPRLYKEGGLLRWRERKMDSIIRLQITGMKMPHIVINATKNEKAMQSNLTQRFNDEWLFQFEGVHGRHYDVFADPKHRILTWQLFTPDVLDVVYTRMPLMDIEVRDDSVWFVMRYGILDDKLANSMYDAVREFIPEFEKQLKSARLMQYD